MLSIQKITGFVNDCVTFRQKTTFYATSSGLFSTRALVRPSGRIAPAAVSAILVSVGPASSYTSTENSTTLRTMWPYLKDHVSTGVYRAVRYNLGGLTDLKFPGGDKLTLGVYRQLRKVFKFN